MIDYIIVARNIICTFLVARNVWHSVGCLPSITKTWLFTMATITKFAFAGSVRSSLKFVIFTRLIKLYKLKENHYFILLLYSVLALKEQSESMCGKYLQRRC